MSGRKGLPQALERQPFGGKIDRTPLKAVAGSEVRQPFKGAFPVLQPEPEPEPEPVFAGPDRARMLQQAQAQRSRTARRESTRQAQVKRDQQRDEVGALAIKFAIDKLGKRQGNNYAERVRRAIRLNQNIPLPPAGEGREVFMEDFAKQGLSGTALRKIGFDVPRGSEVVGGDDDAGVGGVIVGGGRGVDRPPPERIGPVAGQVKGGGTFKQPSGRFEVDRVAQGNNIQDVIERIPQPRPEPEPEPEEREIPLIDRRKIGGASGGLPTQRSAPAGGGRTTQEILAQQRSNFIAGAGLQRGRSVDTAEASGELSAGARFLLKQREERIARELESAPLGREEVGSGGSGTPRGGLTKTISNVLRGKKSD